MTEHASLCISIKNALTTPNGAVLRQWLKENCFMTECMKVEQIDSVGANQRVNARRDLYIALENLLQEGLHHVTDPDD